MRIRAVTTAVVEANYDWTIVRVESDEGVLGWGEAFARPVCRRPSASSRR